MKFIDLLKRLFVFILVSFITILLANLFQPKYNITIAIIIAIAILFYVILYLLSLLLNTPIANKAVDISGFFLTEKGRNIIEAMESMGVTDVYSKLRGSPADPRNCVKIAKRSLYFMGGTASKWRDLEALTGLSKLPPDVEVKFLLFDPDSDKKTDFHKLRKIEASKTYFEEISNANKNIQIRLFDSLPYVRLNIIDNNVMYLYSYHDHNPQNSYGEETPVIKLENESNIQKPLFEAFAKCFENMWNEAKVYK